MRGCVERHARPLAAGGRHRRGERKSIHNYHPPIISGEVAKRFHACVQAAAAADTDAICTFGGGSLTDGAKAVVLCLALELTTPEAMRPYRSASMFDDAFELGAQRALFGSFCGCLWKFFGSFMAEIIRCVLRPADCGAPGLRDDHAERGGIHAARGGHGHLPRAEAEGGLLALADPAEGGRVRPSPDAADS